MEPSNANRRSIRVILVEPNRLTRELLTSLLEKHADDFSVASVPMLAEVGATPREPPGVILVCTRMQRIDDPALKDLVRRLIEQWPDVPHLMISERTQDIDLAMSAVSDGWAGFFPASLGIDLLVAAIRLVHAQGLFLPPMVIKQCAQRFSPIR